MNTLEKKPDLIDVMRRRYQFKPLVAKGILPFSVDDYLLSRLITVNFGSLELEHDYPSTKQPIKAYKGY